MGDRNPTHIRNEKGNHYCMNCQQPVFAKTHFSKFEMAIFMAVVALAGFAIGLQISRVPWLGIIYGIPVGGVLYIIYWYFGKKPVCPICRSRHFESFRNQQERTSLQNRSPNQQPNTRDNSPNQQPNTRSRPGAYEMEINVESNGEEKYQCGGCGAGIEEPTNECPSCKATLENVSEV